MEENGSAAMMVSKRAAGVTSEVNLRMYASAKCEQGSLSINSI